MIINCIIVEDEQPAVALLKLYLEQIPECKLVGCFDNAIAAFSFLQSNPVDLMFLDIKMPKMTGLTLLRSLDVKPKVIITTAFRDYAVDAYELDVIDYLLKPISEIRFLKSISKFNSYAGRMVPSTEVHPGYDNAYIFLKVGRDQVKVFLKDILFIEGLKDYIKVHTVDRMLIAYERLGYMEEKLPVGMFLRVHKSFIVALDKVDHFNADGTTVRGRDIPIGRVYKQNFIKAMAGNH
jgi:DNA-binding LytR/AlgR family response regulator